MDKSANDITALGRLYHALRASGTYGRKRVGLDQVSNANSNTVRENEE
jgi:hypothetical protein